MLQTREPLTLASPPRGQGMRRGLSLTEVLIAIFIMGIGMIALLSLFPLGLLNMAWAIKDDRAARAANTAINNADVVQIDPSTNQPYSLRTEPNYLAAAQQIPDGLGQGLLWWHRGGFANPPTQPAYDEANGPRPPIFVDSLGVLAYQTLPTPDPLAGTLGIPPRWGFSIGARSNAPNFPDCITQPALGMMRPILPGIPRVRSAHIMGLSDAIRACFQEDEITFGTNAQPVNSGTIMNIERANRFSWAYMCRFPKGDDYGVVDMSIVLYDGRRLAAATPGERTSGELRYFGHPNTSNAGFLSAGLTPATGLVFVKGSNLAIIDLYDYRNYAATSNTLPPSDRVASPFKRGDVILDNTLVMPDFFTYPTAPPTRYYAPFDSQFTYTPNVPVPGAAGTLLRKGLANGYFYKVVHVGPVEAAPGNHFVQQITLDRPALADGYEAVYMNGVIDVIEKSNGRLAAR